MSGRPSALDFFEGAPRRPPSPPPTLLRLRVRPPREVDNCERVQSGGSCSTQRHSIRFQTNDDDDRATEASCIAALPRGSPRVEMDPIRVQPFCGRTVSDFAARRCTCYVPLGGCVGASPMISANGTPQRLDGLEDTAVTSPFRPSTDGSPQDRVQRSEMGGHHTYMAITGLVHALMRLEFSGNSAPDRTRRHPGRIR